MAPTIIQEPVCCKCHGRLDPLRTQLTGKSQGSWKCNRCNCKHVQLVRLFGGWPPQEFKDFSQAEQVAFWRMPASGAAQLKRQVEDVMRKARRETQLTDVGGEYLPLSVYKQRGYDVDQIEKHCHDVREDEIFGKVYRVKTMAVHSQTAEEQERVLTYRGTRKAKKPAELEDKPAEEEEAVAVSSGSSDSDSDSDSSSSSSRKHKKSKKGGSKKDKKKKGSKHEMSKKDVKRMRKEEAAAKQRAKEEQQRKVARAAEVRRCKTDATKVLAKVAPLQVEFQNLLADTGMTHVPKFAAQKAKACAKQLEKVEVEAKAKLHQEDPSALSVTLADVTDIVQGSRTSLALLKDFLQSARKHLG